MAFVLRRPPEMSAKYAAYPYQLDAVRAVKDLSYAAIFHEQGLGKTKIAIDIALTWLKEDATDTVIIVTKKALVDNWCNEVEMHCHVTPHVLSANRGSNSAALNSPVLLYIANYEAVASSFDIIKLFLRTCRVGCILDESQKIKNPQARLTRTFLDLSSGFEKRVIMTGTPVANRPFDIWAQVKFLDGGQALGRSFELFQQQTDLPKNPSALGDYSSHLGSVMQKLKRFVVRETKESAGIDLPQKTISSRFVDLPNWQMLKYAEYRDKLAYEYERNGEIRVDEVENVLKRLLRLVQCASNPGLIDGNYEQYPGKYLSLVDLCQEIPSDSKLIVWTGFVENAEWLFRRLSKYQPLRVHGKLTIEQRNGAIRTFKKSSNKLLIATPGAAKEGLTLTVANHSVFYDRGFSLDDYLQAQDRTHRISQTRECYVYNLIARDTIDEWVNVLLNAKYKAAQLTQGDIDSAEFLKSYAADVLEILAEILTPQNNSAADREILNAEDSL